MNIILQSFGSFLVAVYFCLILIPVVLIAAPFPLLMRLKIISPAWRGFAKTILKNCHAQLTSIDRRSMKEQNEIPPYGLFIANHQSYLDIPLILTKIQLPPIMKKQVMYIPLFGLIGWVSGSLVVDRNKKDSRKKIFQMAIKRMIDEKIGLQYYPEATRGRGRDPKVYSEIKTPLIEEAFQNKIPVYPISMFGTNKVLSQKGLLNPFQKLGIIMHEAVDPHQFKDKSEFCQFCWEKVRSGYFELKNQIEN
jgi:1-acyl-sn-glycerol-3-phosphate acyltransferase